VVIAEVSFNQPFGPFLIPPQSKITTHQSSIQPLSFSATLRLGFVAQLDQDRCPLHRLAGLA
jgi:hypothetical protein